MRTESEIIAEMRRVATCPGGLSDSMLNQWFMALGWALGNDKAVGDILEEYQPMPKEWK